MKKFATIYTILIAFLLVACQGIEAPEIQQVKNNHVDVISRDNNTIIEDVTANQGNCRALHAYTLADKELFLKLVDENLIEEREVVSKANTRQKGSIRLGSYYERKPYDLFGDHSEHFTFKDGINVEYAYYIKGLNFPIFKFDMKNRAEVKKAIEEENKEYNAEYQKVAKLSIDYETTMKNLEKELEENDKKFRALAEPYVQEYRQLDVYMYKDRVQELKAKIAEIGKQGYEKKKEILSQKNRTRYEWDSNLSKLYATLPPVETYASYLKNLYENDKEKYNRLKKTILANTIRRVGIRPFEIIGKLELPSDYDGLLKDIGYPAAMKFGERRLFQLQLNCVNNQYAHVVREVTLITNGGNFSYDIYPE